MDIFEQASRLKVRFETSRGSLTVEDLWSLPLTSNAGKTNLDEIALSLYKQVRNSADVVSFVDEKAKSSSTAQLQFDIVKHIIEDKKAENAAAVASRSKAALKQTLLEALDRKRTGALETLSEEDLLKKINEL